MAIHACPWMRDSVCVCVWIDLKTRVLHKHLDWFSNGRIQPKTQSTFPAMCSSLYLSAFPSRMNNWKHSVSTPDHKRSRMLLNYHTFRKGEKAVCCSVSQIRLKRSNSVSSSHTQKIYTCTIQLCWSILINLRKSRIGFKIPFSGKIRDVGMSYHICCSWCVQWKELKIVSKTLLIFSYICDLNLVIKLTEHNSLFSKYMYFVIYSGRFFLSLQNVEAKRKYIKHYYPWFIDNRAVFVHTSSEMVFLTIVPTKKKSPFFQALWKQNNLKTSPTSNSLQPKKWEKADRGCYSLCLALYNWTVKNYINCC